MAEGPAAVRQLLPHDALLRVLLRKAELDDPLSAFYLRANEKGTGLSVNFDYTQDEARAQDCFKKTYGVRSLTVQSVRELQLGVRPDAPHHANITGVPHVDEDPKRAEYLAGQLAKVSTLLSQGLVRNRQ